MSRASPLIAIVDDEEAVCRALKRLMISAGFEAVAFTCGSDFLEYIKTVSPDCLVLDLNMPQMSGLEILLKLAQMGNKLPVVTITGRDNPQARTSAIKGGASAYLCKPISDTTLLDAVLSAIASKPDSKGKF